MNGYFDELEYPVDMDSLYHELKYRAQRERKVKSAGPPDLCYEKVLPDYQRNELTDTWYFTYPSNAILAHHIGEEFAFACATKRRANDLTHIYYISDAYNIDLATGEPVRARFVFFHTLNKFRLVAMAEEPAELFASAESMVERVYARMRNSYFAGEFHHSCGDGRLSMVIF